MPKNYDLTGPESTSGNGRSKNGGGRGCGSRGSGGSLAEAVAAGSETEVVTERRGQLEECEPIVRWGRLEEREPTARWGRLKEPNPEGVLAGEGVPLSVRCSRRGGSIQIVMELTLMCLHLLAPPQTGSPARFHIAFPSPSPAPGAPGATATGPSQSGRCTLFCLSSH
jgi:hypothetical protein